MPEAACFEKLAHDLIVSRETIEKLKIYEQLLVKWQASQNLVSSTTLNDIWDRHFADSLQLLNMRRKGRWADLGSGAGFPGLVLAMAEPQIQITLIESNQGKCAFLREVARQTGTSVNIVPQRAETALQSTAQFDVFTSRALAPLTQLCQLIAPVFGKESVALFFKGRNLEAEIIEAKRMWDFAAQVTPSLTSKDSSIIKITDLKQRVM